MMFFFFNDTATTEIYTLSPHDALPIYSAQAGRPCRGGSACSPSRLQARQLRDRKSTRLNSSHSQISYAVFCLKKKKNKGVRGSWLRHPPVAVRLFAESRRHDRAVTSVS